MLLINSWQLIIFDKKQESCVKRIHLVTNNDLYDRKAFYKVKNVFSSFSMNDAEFINHKYIKDYEKYKKSSYRKYWDVNNLYGRAMS